MKNELLGSIHTALFGRIKEGISISCSVEAVPRNMITIGFHSIAEQFERKLIDAYFCNDC